LSDVASRIVVRAATRADAAAIARVQHESWRTTYAGILPLDVINSVTGHRDASEWQRRLERETPDAATWIAERGGKIVGFASCGPARADVERLDGEIYALYVLQKHQRRGVGRELVRECARHFVRHGVFGFFLWVLRANRARMFYEALGGEALAEKIERLGKHDFAEIAYGWRDLTALVVADEPG
jgi:ribosomal protein S18 acetylase RimI-like enzyme